MNAIELSSAQNAIYKTFSQNVTAKNGTTAEFIRDLVRFGHRQINEKQSGINERLKQNNDTLSKRLADEANIKLQQELNQHISDIKTVLTKETSRIFDRKKDTITHFIRQIPSDTLNRKIQYIRDYGYLLDKEVWEMFVTDPDIISNYLASKAVEKIAEQNGIDYVVPFNPVQTLDKLNQFEAMVNVSIANIDNDDNLTMMSFINDNPNSPVSKLIHDLDTDIATIIPAERKTVLNRLKQAKQQAYDKDDVALSVRIGRFIDNNMTELSTPEELHDALYEQAEELIQLGLNVKKGVR